MKFSELTNIKNILGINNADHDDFLNLQIERTSFLIESYLDRKLSKNTLTEKLKGTDRQNLYTTQWPILSITSIKGDGVNITDYTNEGTNLYKETGWNYGAVYSYDLTPRFIDFRKNIEIEYEYGYLLPGNVGYVYGQDDSLPTEITIVCEDIVCQIYNAKIAGNYSGNFKSLSQGGISYSFADTKSAQDALARLVSYKRVVIA